ncbi:TonB-dependent receptor [uncultured Cytophaga sp.]|uniref:TonB-dependent receptor domain-containing protein n=1 Tax=uncultured Cytophaga sp. TaxID=160238 RepID=UPI002624EDFC|nr:TonB-dependent receptor [uncultured Cytophaga sp.]
MKNTLRFPKWLATTTMLLLISMFSTSYSNAQTGSVKGILMDSTANELLFGAIVASPENPNLGAQSDMDGIFDISAIEPGTYNFIVSYIGYKEHTIKNVIVYAGQVTDIGTINISIDEGASIVEVVGQLSTNTETAVIVEVRQQEEVVSGISSEQISKSQDRDAAQVVSRIAGVTIVDNSFILVRGLNRRYNGIMLNGVMAPSSEIDSRAFALDLIPSNMIDRMLVFKSGSDQLPGDMTGSLVKIYTRSIVTQKFTNITGSLSYRNGTTFTSRQSQSVGGTEFLGFNNSRSLPSSMPADLNGTGVIYDPAAQENAAKSLKNDWSLKNTTVMPDLRLGANIGRYFYINKAKVSNITSLSYTRTSQYYKAERSRNLYITPTDFNPLFNYTDQVLQKNTRINALSNWSVVMNTRNKIEFRNLFNQTGLNQTVLREGINKKAGSSPSSWLAVEDRALYYQERGIYSGQLGGTHDLANNKTSFEWTTGLSYIYRNEPSYRRGGSQATYGSGDPQVVVIPGNATDNDAATYESKLKEHTIAATANIEHMLVGLKDSVNTFGLKLRAGFYTEKRNRTFESRWMSYIKQNPGTFDNSISAQPIETIFDAQNIGYGRGLILSEGTDGTNKYDASNTLFAGYVGTGIYFTDKTAVTMGLRGEHNTQKINTKNQSGKDLHVSNPILNLLPSIGVNYNFTKKMQVRASFATTINRPEFREIAPFGFYDFENSWKVNGNPDLKNSIAQNVDVRWELYPSEDQAITVGAFYKDITNPIEFYVQPIGGQDQNFYYDNAPKAKCYGLELEVRKTLGFLAPTSTFAKRFTMVLNGSLIKSEVNLNSTVSGQASRRPMQGQSPYVINAAIYYANIEKRIQANVVYNVFGNRLFGVGDANFATIYEMNRNTLDMTITKGLSEKFELKLGIQNILNAKYRLVEDSNRNFKVDTGDQTISTYKKGAYFTIGGSYKF